MIRQLAEDIPTLWQAESTTAQDRQQIVRMLIDRIELLIDRESEQMELTITWAGGFTSQHQHSRPISSYAQLSTREELLKRIVELKQTGITLIQVAEQLNQEEHVSVKGIPVNAPMLSRLLVKEGIHLPRGSQVPDSEILKEHEWWLKDLAAEIEMPASSVSNWLKSGWVTGRKLPGGRGRWILWADESEIARLRELRSARRRWSDCPYPAHLTTPNCPSTEHSD